MSAPMSIDKDNFSVNLEIHGKLLVCSIILDKQTKDNFEYYFSIYKNGIKIIESGWLRNTYFELEHYGYGEYEVQGHIKYQKNNTWKRSEKIAYFDPGNIYSNPPSIYSKGSNLISDLSFNDIEDITSQVYLLRYGEVVWKSEQWSENNTYKWKLGDLEDGIYCAQWFVRIGKIRFVVYSESYLWITEKMKDQIISSFDKKQESFDPPNLPNSHYPDKQFVLHQKKKTKNIDYEIKKASNKLSSTVLVDSDSTKIELFYEGDLHRENNDLAFFSGFSNCGKNFIFGQDDLFLCDHIRDIHDTLGKFTLVHYIHNEGKVEIHSDFFGVRHNYYFQNENEVICSNNLHLLMEALRANSIEIDINWKSLSSMFAFNNVQPFAQNFSRNLPIYGLKKIPSGITLVFNSDGMKKDNSGLHDLVENAGKNEIQYDEIIDEAIIEMRTNCQAVLNNSRFKKYSVDLSGGMDTRLTTAILSAFGNENLEFSCTEHPSEPHELTIACEINSKLGLRWCIPKSAKMANDQSTIFSRFFGDYYAHNDTQYFSKFPSQNLRITGFFGEVCARDYYGRSLRKMDVSSDQYFNSIYRYSILGNRSDFGMQSAEKIFTEELDILNKDFYKAMELHYCHFRSGSHCDSQWRNYINGPDWSPLQSKNLFTLKYSNENRSSFPRIQLDAILSANRDLGNLPFSGEQDNIDYGAYQKKVPRKVEDFEQKKDSIKQRIDWEESMNQAEIFPVSEIKDGWGGAEKEFKNQKKMFSFEETTSFIFHNCSKRFIDDVLVPIGLYKLGNNDTKSLNQIRNKLATAALYLWYTIQCRIERI